MTVQTENGTPTAAGNVRLYINDDAQAARAVELLVQQFAHGDYSYRVSIDLETSPIPGLEGYPGARRVVKDGVEVFVKASKDEYLRFAQRVWRAGWERRALSALGAFVPTKLTSGKVGHLDAKAAWQMFLAQLEELFATEEGRAQLEAARWTTERYQAAVALNASEQGNCRIHIEELEEFLASNPKKGVRDAQRELKAWKASLEELEAQAEFLTTEVPARVAEPLDLRLAMHVTRVGVEGRVYLTKEGRNRLDPVQPGLDPQTSTIFLTQFTFVGVDGHKYSYVFNTHKVALSTLAPLFSLKGALYVGANLKFDLRLLMHHLGFAPTEVYCVRVASRMLYLGLKLDHDLKSVAKRFIKQDLSKEIRNDFVGQRMDEPTEEMLGYSFVDTEVLPDIFTAQLAKAEKTGQVKLIHDFGKLSWLAAHWEYTGYRVDAERWMEINAEAARWRDETARELEKMLLPQGYAATFAASQPVEGEDDTEALLDDDDEEGAAPDVRPDAVVRISQTKLVLELLEDLLGLGDLGAFTPNGKPSLSKDARNAVERAYRAKHKGEGHPFFLLYTRWAKLAKQVSTYGRRFLWYVHPLTGRIHPQFHIAGTDTARFSSTGPNFLNIPAAKEEGDPDFRGAFLANEGMLLLGADYETMELRIAGDISQDPVVKKMVESGADAHGFTAAQMFHIEKAPVSTPSKQTRSYRRGTMEVPITVFTVPQHWTAEQVAEYALTEEVQAAVAEVMKKLTRGDAKSVTFLWLFQGTPYTLAQRTGLPVEVCEDFFGRFAGVYVVMDSYMKDLAETVYTNYIDGEDGRRYAWSEGYGGIRRWVLLPHNPHDRDYHGNGAYLAAAREYKRMMRRAQRELCNLPMQGGNAVITTEALLRIVERGRRYGIIPWLAIYDEILVTFPATVRPALVKSVLEGSMLEAADQYMTYIQAGAEADLGKVGTRWVKS